MSTGYIDIPTGGGVSSLNGLAGALTLVAGNNITITPGTTTLTISALGINAPLTGYVPSPGVITSADTILSAIQKLDGNLAKTSVGQSLFLYYNFY